MKKIFIIIVLLLLVRQVFAQEKTEQSATDLAKKTQNPVADLISLPFQFNTFFETGPKGKTQNSLLIQPVIPFSLNDNWNFIARPIIPLLELPPLTDAQNRNHGLGNIQFQGFFSPKEKVGDWILGFGPYLEFPTNSGPDNRFGSDNWSAGPAFVALQMKGPWVYGGLLTHLWSYHGNDPEVNITAFQPFINYNMDDGWYLSMAPTITSNWSAESSQRWTIPIGGGIEFMRPWTESVYGIPPEQVIGSSIKTKFEFRNGTPVLVRLPELNFFDDKAGKPVAINQHIGRRPIAAFGNSDGDLQMLQWTAAGEGPRFCLYVHHTDAQREWAYDRESHIGRLDKGLDEANTKGWTVVDMKKDWKTVFSFEKK